MTRIHPRCRTLRRWMVVLFHPMLLAAIPCPASAQQDPANRLWQGIEQQQSQRRDAPAPLENEAPGKADDPALAALTQTPEVRVQRLLLAVLNAVNRRDWFGADRLLRRYAQVPRHDPALFTYVAASRAAAAGDYDTALAGFHEVQRASPRFTRGTLDLARTLYADNRLRDAREAFDRLRTQPLPPEVLRHIDEYLQAIGRRGQALWSLSLWAVREDNVNGASTVVDPCALVFLGTCLANNPGRKIADSGVYAEASVNKQWPLAGRHGLLLRSINYGTRYQHEDAYGSLVSTTYLGYQYASARSQFQLLPLFEYDNEGGREIYRAFGLRAGFKRQLGVRAQVEASVEYKARRFAARFAENLEGDFRGAVLFGQYALRPGLLAYGHLAWRDSDARLPVFAYREKAARLGIYKSFADRVTLNAAYGWRRKQADGANAVFGKRQRDRERSLYLSVSLPGYGWQGLTPVATYEYRDNRSSIPHAYDYEKNRLMLGFNAVF